MRRKFLFLLMFIMVTSTSILSLTACNSTSIDNHNIIYVEGTEPTCTENGNIDYWICSECGKYFSDAEATTEISKEDTIILALGHSYGEWQVINETTCTDDGEYYRECFVCHHIENKTIEATGHTFTDWQIENAEHVRTCTSCGLEQRENHIYENGVCTICGKASTFEYGDVTISLDWYSSNKQEYYIYDLYDFNGLAYLVNNNIDSFENKTVLFGCDLDFGLGNYLTIGDMAYVDYQDTDYAFRGTLKGNGYKILNYSITDENVHTVYYPYSKAPLHITSLFLKNYGRIENIVVDNFSIDTSITEEWTDLQNSYKFSVLTFENYGEIINCSLSGSFDCFIDADQPFSNVSILFNTNYGYITNTSVDCTANIIRNTPCVSYSQFGCYNYGRIENSIAYGSINYTNSNSARTGSYSGFVMESNYSNADNVYYNLYDKWIPIYGEQGLYSCKSYTDIYSNTYNRDAVCGIATASTSAIMDCEYSGKIILSANSDDVLIDGVISGITGNINNSPFSKSTISGCIMSGEIDFTVNKIYDDGYLRTLAITGIVGEILSAKEETIISNNEFNGSIVITDNTTVTSSVDNVSYHIAGIVGKSMLHWSNENPPSHTTITNCKMNGTIEANVHHISVIGGIASYLYRNNDCAGLVGNDFTVEVSSCLFNGQINVKNCDDTIVGFGGIVGQMSSVNITDCTANGNFGIDNSNGAFFGTIVGQSTSSLSFENGYTMPEIINCEGHVIATIDGQSDTYSNTFGYVEWTYIKNENIETELNDKYYYNTLDDNKKALYAELYTWFVEIANYPYLVFAPNPYIGPIDYGKYNLSDEDFLEVFMMVRIENPQFFYISNTFFTYENSNGELAPYAEPKVWDRYLDQAISDDQDKLQTILNSISEATSSLSKQEKVKYIYDYIKDNTEYTQYDEYTSTIIGTLLNGTAICEGYSLTFKYLCDYLGINCIVITSDEMDHAWNMVEVKGEWYYVDVTWADTSSKEYFLMGSDEFTLDHYAFNDYLNLPTASKDNYNL